MHLPRPAPGRAPLLHASVATALATSAAAAPGGLARHWDAAGRSVEALRASLAAARAAQRAHAPAESYLHYRRVLDLWDEVPDAAAVAGTSRDALLLPAAEAASHAGRNIDAQDLVRARLRTTSDQDLEQRADCLAALRAILLRGGRTKEADAVVTELVHLAPRLTGPSRPGVLTAISRQYNVTGYHVSAWRFGEDALAAARELDDPVLIAEAAGTAGWARLALGGLEGAALLRQAIESGRRRGSGRDIAAATVATTCGLLALHRYPEAVRQAEETLEELSLYGLQASAMPVQRGNLMEGLFGSGRWDEAQRLADQLALVDVVDRSTCAEAVYRVLVLIGRGEHDRAVAVLESVGRIALEITDTQLRWEYATQWAELCLWRARFTDAEHAVGEALSLLRDRDCVDRLIAACRLAVRLEADRVAAARLAGRPVDTAAAADRASDHVLTAEKMVERISAATGQRSPAFERQLDVVRAEHHRLVDESDPGRWAAVAARAGGRGAVPRGVRAPSGRWRCCGWSGAGCPTRRSGWRCSSAPRRCRRTSRTCCASSV
jgi:hypothetical protein